jgi:hypothetical protein
MPAGPRATPFPVVVQFSDPTNPITPTKLLESSSLFVNSLSAVTISATNYQNLPAIGGATSVGQLDGTGIFVLTSTNNSLSSLVYNIELSTVALSAYIAANQANWAATGGGSPGDLAAYVLTSVNFSLSSLVNSHISDGTIHFTSGSLSSSYALSSWVNDNFIDTTEIIQYATTGSLLPYALTASLSNYLLTSINVTSLAGTSTFETTGYARANYATTGQLQSYVLTSTNISLSSIVTGHIDDGTIHFTSGSLSSVYALSSWVNANFIDNTEITQYATTGSLLQYALTASLSNYLVTSVNVTSLAGTGVFALTGTIALSSLTDVTITNPQNYQVLTWNGTSWQPSAIAGVGTAASPGGATNDIQYNAGGGSFGGANGLTWTPGSQLLSAVSIYSVNASATTISATNYLNLPNFATTATNVTSFQGTGIFETTGYARVNYATTGQLNSYVLTSVNSSLSSTVIGHISDNSIHFTSGSLSGAYVLTSINSNLSSLVSNIQASTISLSSYIAANESSWSSAGATYLSSLLDVDVTSNNLPKHGDMIYYASSFDGVSIINKWVTLESDVNGSGSVLKLLNDGNGGVYPTWDNNRLINLQDVFIPNTIFNSNETIVYSSIDIGGGNSEFKFIPTPLPPYGFNEINCLIDGNNIGDILLAGPTATNLNISSPNNTIIASGFAPGGGSKVLNLSVSNIFLSSNLQDVNVTSVSQGDSLVWDGSYWIASAIEATPVDLSPYVLTSTNFVLSSLVSSIQTSTIALSSYIAANESAWLAGGGVTVPSESSAVVFVGNPGTSLSANAAIRINNSASTLQIFSDAASETGGIDLFPNSNTEGLIRWDPDYHTLGIQGDDETRITLGIDEIIPVRNNTGLTIYKGQVAYVSGAATGAFRGTISPMDQFILNPFSIGVCLKTITNGNDGYLIKHGLIKNASISDVIKPGTVLTTGDILYVSDSPGKLTNVIPGPGNHAATVGIFLASGTGQISFGVTVKEFPDLQDLHDVGANPTQNGDTLAWDASLGYYVTSSLNSYVLTSVNTALSSTVTGHIADGTIHFTSGSLSSAYALSSWVSNNFIDNTEITAYATTASVQQYETTAYARNNYLLTSVNVTSLAGTSTFETTGYARTNYATTGQIQSYVLTSTNLNLSTLVGSIETSTIGLSSVLGSHISSAVHWTRDQLNTDYINASGDSVNSNFYFNSLSASVISATTYYNVRPLVSSVNSNSVTSFTVDPVYDYYIVSTADSKVFVDLPNPAGLVNKFIAISKIEQDGSHRSVTVSSQYLKIGGVGTVGQNSVSIFDPTEKVEFISDGTSWNLLGFQKSYGVVTIAKNQTGATIPKGTPVKNCGSSNGVILVSGVSSTNTSLPVSIYDLPDCIGLTEHSIPNNEFGHIISKGTLYDVDTGSFFVGDELYVAENGGLTRSKPTQPYEVILVGTVTIAHATSGIIEVDIKDLIHLNDIVGFNVDPSLLNNSVASDWTVLRYSNTDKAFINSKINVANVEGTGVFETSAYSRTNFLLTSVNVTSLAGTSTFETTAYARNNYATTGQLGAYVLTSVNFSLSSLVNSHISDGTIHFTSGSLSSAYALSSWVNDTFETTSYARTTYATTGQLQSYVLTSVNLSLSSLVNNHIGSAVHWTRDQLNSDYINASGDSVNSKFYFSGVSATTLSATTYQGVSLSGSLTDVTIASPVDYQVLTWYNGTWQPSSITGAGPGGGTPGGNSTELQYNNGGSFGGTSELVWNSTPKLLSGTNIAALNFSGGTVSATTYLNLPNFTTTSTNVTAFQGTGIFETTAYARTNYAYLSGAVFTGGVSASQFSATNYYNLPSGTAIWNANSLLGVPLEFNTVVGNLTDADLLFYSVSLGNKWINANGPVWVAAVGAIFNANKIQGTSVTATAPTNKQGLIYDSTGTSWKPTTLNLSTTLNDVQITTVANDNVLTWSSTAGKWVPKAFAAAAAKNLSELEDVNVDTVPPNQSLGDYAVLQWDNSVDGKWEGMEAATWISNVQSNIDHNSLTNLPNGNPHTQYATLSGSVFTGGVSAVTISATNYVNLPSGTAIWNASQLRGVNVTATTPTTHQALVYDGVNWTPSSLPSPVGTTPGGPSTSVQFNNNGQFSGVAEFDFIASGSRLEVPILSATTVSANTFAMTYVSAALAADIQMPTSNAFVIGPSATIGPGTWLVNAHATLNRSTTTAATYTVRVALGSTTVASTSQYHASVAGIATNVSLTCIVSTGASTTIGIRAATSAGATTELLKASAPISADGNNATIITALKIG